MTVTSAATRTTTPAAAQHSVADEAVSSSRTWSINTTGDITVTGYLPPWADEDPSDTDVPLEKLSAQLIDLSHWKSFDGQLMCIHHPAHAAGDGKAGEGEDIVFSGNITCYPYSEDPQERTPFVNVRVVDDFWINNLTPDGLATLAAKLRAQADYLENNVAPTLEAFRRDWDAHQIERANHVLQ
jgi:hypothetical protein